MKHDLSGVKMWAVALEKSMHSCFELKRNTQFPKYSNESEQITLALNGGLTFAFAEKRVILKEGDVIFIPSNDIHSASTSSTLCKVVHAWSPTRKEYR